MRVVYLDCASGISGDMMLGALLDVGAPLDLIRAGLDSLGLDDCRIEVEEVRRRGFRATKLHVRHTEQHAHRHLSDIVAMIERSQLTPTQRALALRLFRRLGEAEARVHGVPVERVHFHEVGAVDSIADIVGTAIAWDWLAPDSVAASPIPTGSGFVEIAHGRVRLPAPATAELLRGIPLESTSIPYELTTPTGATMLAELVSHFGDPPSMTIEQIGYGAGDRDLTEQPNLLRILVGDAPGTGSAMQDCVEVLETQVDDLPAEWLGYAMDRLLEAGARDVYFTPIMMKKNRPATLVTVLAPPELADQLETILFTESTTLGVRRTTARRRVLGRREGAVSTPWGEVMGKWVELPDGRTRFAPEYESCRKIAQSHQVPIQEVYRVAVAAVSISGSDEIC